MSRPAWVASVAGAGLLLALAVAAVWPSRATPEVDYGMYAQFCTPIPPAAVVADPVPADHRIAVKVPPSTMAPRLEGGSHETRIVRGEVVELVLQAPIAGAASVHGLSDLVMVKADDRATLRFRAIYSGRFPVHFHGADGSHYGVWALNIVERSPS